MAKCVLAVFSGTAVNEAVFREALARARTEDAALVLLNVRHLEQASRLGRALSRETYLGRGAIERLTQSVKRERDRAIGRALEAMVTKAREARVPVEVWERKGEFADTVESAARAADAGLVVLEDSPERNRIHGEFRVTAV